MSWALYGCPLGRTLAGAAGSASEFKYIPVRRLALYIEASVDRATAWSTFEPNAQPAWSELRASTETFMLSMFGDGALAGATPRSAGPGAFRTG